MKMFLDQIQYFEDTSHEIYLFKGVKGRLAKHIQFLEDIGANSFVIDTIKMVMLFHLLTRQVE